MEKSDEFDIGIVNRFSQHKCPGDFAETYFRKNYFKGLDLNFRKIRKDKNGVKPDGYILNNDKNKIAVAEIKLIKNQEKQSDEAYLVTIDETITRTIKKAKKQLKTIGGLPKIVYLILDDISARFKTVKSAILGRWITETNSNGKIIYNNYSGLRNKESEDNKLRDNLLSAVVCYKKTLNSYKIYIIRNTDSIDLPRVLLDQKHLIELWGYNCKKGLFIIKNGSQ